MSQSRPTKRAARACIVGLAVLALAGSGCVERRMIIRTNPPGALVYVDDNEIDGVTPVAISPIYYGNRKIRIVKDGYETLTIIQSVPPPWYEIPPLDFISETLVPGKIKDVRTFDYQLHPQAMVQQDTLLGRAEELRRGTQTMPGVTIPGYRINQPPPGTMAPGNPGGPAVGGQPSYQLPPGTAVPNGPVYNPQPGPAPYGGAPYSPAPSGQAPAGTAPLGPAGPIYQAPPSMPATSPGGPADFGSQPYHALPSGQ
jgi:hypothetical protein